MTGPAGTATLAESLRDERGIGISLRCPCTVNERGGTATVGGGGGQQGGFLLLGRGPASLSGAENVGTVDRRQRRRVAVRAQNTTSLSAVDMSAALVPRQEQARAPSSGEEWESVDSDSEGTRQGTSVL